LIDKHPKEKELAIRLKHAYDKESKQGNYKEEITGWKELVKNHPQEGVLQHYLAEVYAKNEDTSEEIAGWKDLLNYHPEEKSLRDRLLNVCLQCETVQDAMYCLQGLDTMHPKNLELLDVLKDMFPSKVKETKL
jgi:predicted Zn-dependent protease